MPAKSEKAFAKYKLHLLNLARERWFCGKNMTFQGSWGILREKAIVNSVNVG